MRGDMTGSLLRRPTFLGESALIASNKLSELRVFVLGESLPPGLGDSRCNFLGDSLPELLVDSRAETGDCDTRFDSTNENTSLSENVRGTGALRDAIGNQNACT